MKCHLYRKLVDRLKTTTLSSTSTCPVVWASAYKHTASYSAIEQWDESLNVSKYREGAKFQNN